MKKLIVSNREVEQNKLCKVSFLSFPKFLNFAYSTCKKIGCELLKDFFFFFFFEFIDLNKQAVIYKAKALKQIQINSKGQP